MFERIPRWSWLGVFAACNLLFWIAVAVGVGALASDKVDLGIESFIRAQQSTAVAAWHDLATAEAANPLPSPGASRAAAVQTSWSTQPATDAVEPTLIVEAAIVDEPTAAVELALATKPTLTAELASPPEATVAATPTAAPTVRPRPTRVVAPSPTPQPSAPVSAASRAPQPSPTPTTTLMTSPLLLADPDLDDLAGLQAEMSRSALGRPVQIRWSEAQLNSEITELLAQNADLPYHNLRIDLKRDHVVLNGDVSVMGFLVNTEVQGTVLAQDCRPQAEIDRISIAGLVTPGFVKENIKSMVAESLDWYPADYPLCIEQIVLEEDGMTIYGSRR